MIRIAICEDEKPLRVALTELLECYCEERGQTYQIDTYPIGEELLRQEGKQYDVIFLDIEMYGGANGIEIARALRQADYTGFIIFLTSHSEQVYEAFEVEAFRYLLKPIQQSILVKTMDIILKKMVENKKNKIVLTSGKEYIQLSSDDIIYIETEERKVKVHTFKENYKVDERINALEEKLSGMNFCRVHRSYLINLKYVESHKEDSVTLKSGEVVYVSRLKMTLFKKKFMDYLRSDMNVGEF